MPRPPDPVRRRELLDHTLDFIIEHGIAAVTMRPLATALGVTPQTLQHHFGSKEEIVLEALTHAADLQLQAEEQWLRQSPGISPADLFRKWWGWALASPRNLGIARVGFEAMALDTTVPGLPQDLRGYHLNRWRFNIESRLMQLGMTRSDAIVEAALARAMFGGLLQELIFSGDRQRLTRSLELGLARLDHVTWQSVGLTTPTPLVQSRNHERHLDNPSWQKAPWPARSSSPAAQPIEHHDNNRDQT